VALGSIKYPQRGSIVAREWHALTSNVCGCASASNIFDSWVACAVKVLAAGRNKENKLQLAAGRNKKSEL
jgi:hypothetical protein